MDRSAGLAAGRAHWLLTSQEKPMSSSVSAVPAASADRAACHFGTALEFETDCADVFGAMSSAQQDFVLLDVRSPELFAQGHVPGAINLPQRKIVDVKLRDYPDATLFVVYCAGPHCNGAHRGAYRLAKLGRPVKLMVGGVTGWVDEGFALARADTA
ncbi:rhodanese-like domain-containing protein [Massilia sp. Dwa41.01b]|nr:rhodanese-like domain-containing protein [Massilia sp. Dwa41.01b]